MLFNQMQFGLFFLIFFIVYYSVGKNCRKYVLLLASMFYVFYQGIISGIVLLAIGCISYAVALWIGKTKEKKKARYRLYAGVSVVIAILLLFKYLAFIAGTAKMLGVNMFSSDLLNERLASIIVPLGLSFYSLRAISYMVEVYKGEKPIRNWIDYETVLSFFPILPSGPIERDSNLYQEIVKDKYFDWDKILKGFKLFIFGLFMKIVLADRLAVCVNMVYGDYNNFAGIICLLAVFMYSVQIYCDFAGYSFMAIGIAKMLDIELMDNFKRPYLSKSIKEFWRRWHISLSSWLRDYIYIPLGGNRRGKIRKNINVLLTFLISGLWHGASWNFVLWGGLHGIYQVLESFFDGKTIEKKDSILYGFFRYILTLILVSFAWIFFRFSSISEAWRFIAHIITDFSANAIASGAIYQMGWGRLQIFGILLSCIVLIAIETMTEWRLLSLELVEQKSIFIRWGIYYITLLWIIVAYIQLYGMQIEANFIYVNF